MQGNDLGKMLKEEAEERKFEKWGNENISFFSDLNEEEKETLKKDYLDADKWKETHSNTLKNAINHLSSDIDYSTDIEKTRVQSDRYSEKLDRTISSLEEKYGNTKSK